MDEKDLNAHFNESSGISNISQPLDTASENNSGGIDFDKLLINDQNAINFSEHINSEVSLNKSDENSIEPAFHEDESQKLNESHNLLKEINEEINKNPEGSGIDITHINIEEFEVDDQKKTTPLLGNSGIGDPTQMLEKLSSFNYRKIVSISLFILIFSLLVSGWVFLWKLYLEVASQAKIDPKYKNYVQYVKDYQKLWSKYTQLNDYAFMINTSFLGDNAKNNVSSILNSKRLSYIQKKDILQKAIDSIGNDIVTHSHMLDTLKQDIVKYGFFPKDLLQIFIDDQQDVSIKKSLLSLEVVKFNTAIRVFSFLETFIKGFANLLGSTPEEVQNTIKKLDQRGDKDIKIYLNTCYLNPYEIDENCNSIGDFDKYYLYNENDNKGKFFDSNFFKKLMYYIDLKLEQSDFPNFNITFQRFDPKQKQLSFSIEVNTFKQDETSLIMQGILNPHIFVVTQLLDLLKQSLFVIGENIDAKQIKIQPKIIQIGSTSFPANSSFLNFTLPLQKNSQREIADFILSKNYYFVNLVDKNQLDGSGVSFLENQYQNNTGNLLFTGQNGNVLTGNTTTSLSIIQ